LARIAVIAGAKLGKADLFWVLIILVSVFLLSWSGIRGKSNTVDEVMHILAGHAYWSLNDYRLAPESGILPDRISALPLQFDSQTRPIDTGLDFWSVSAQWKLAREWWFFSGQDHMRILLKGRMAMLFFNLFGLLLLFIFSARIWGRAGGYFSLLLAGFSPNFLGHIPLATSDFAISWTLTAAVLAYVNLVERPTLSRILISGALAGTAILCKQTGLLIGPIAAIIFLLRTCKDNKMDLNFGFCRLIIARRGQIFAALVAISCVAAVISWVVIWTGYGWRYAAANPEAGAFLQFRKEWMTLGQPGSIAANLIGIAKDFKLLPEAFLYGIDFIIANEERGGFLNGVYSPEGFRLFFLWGFLYKTPLPAIILHLSGWTAIAFMIWKKKGRLDPALQGLVVMAFVYSAILLSTRLNIGYRHAFPVLFVSCIVAAGPFTQAIKSKPGVAFAMAALAMALVPTACFAQNRYISYINAIGGSQLNGYKSLSDSSLDWGQDLPAAREYIDNWRKSNEGKKIYLSTFGTVVPEAYGIFNTEYLEFWGFRARTAYLPELGDGLYILSANVMGHFLLSWTEVDELDYLRLRKRASVIYADLQEAGALDVRTADVLLSKEDQELLQTFERVRFHRMLYYLSSKEPKTVINGSMLAYVLSPEEMRGLNW
jgi:hypothetical protein